ncbi:MAG: transcriptional regulator [Xanthomonadales bacterium]|nr:transcriptional regulator [Xanthomonadales bacterium]
MKTNDKIIQLLKERGAMTAKALATELGITTMGIRQHMLQLEDECHVIYKDKQAVRGRPARHWSLTKQSDCYFPDGHEALTVQLIESVKLVFGESGLDKLIEQREKESFELYSKALDKHNNLHDKLKALAKLRSDEGYMASIEKQNNLYWLLENHCSICAAASQCKSFCRSELHLFQSLLNGQASISREEHIMQGARRCAYKITPNP